MSRFSCKTCGHSWAIATPGLAAPCPRCGTVIADVSGLPTEPPGPPMSGPRQPVSPARGLPVFPGLEVIEEVSPGVGGMGVVYRAREIELDRIVAVKTIRSHLRTPEGREFFISEARSAARLDHPNILRIFRFVPEHTVPFYVMQYVDGRGLAQACKGRDARFIAEVLEKVARALAYAHGRGIVHRDIKPDNILVDFDNEPHIADFGLAGRHSDTEQGTSHGPAGTPGFIAPEVFTASTPGGPSVDVYALGVTLYQLLTARMPFPGRTLEEVRQAALQSDPPLPHEINVAVPEPLQRICLKAMERHPDNRYESAQLLADDLRRYLDGKEVSARPTRYARELRGKFENHLTDIRLWKEQNLIDTTDMDRLSRPYHSVLDAASPYHHLSRQFPWETVVLRLGGWLVLLGVILFPAMYWDRIGAGWKRYLVTGVPALIVNLVGWFLRASGSRINSLIYLSTGAILLGFFSTVLLTETGTLRLPQAPGRELFDLSEHPRHFRPSNAQIVAAALIFAIYCGILLRERPRQLMSFWLGVGVLVLFTGVLLRLGLRPWLENDHRARALLCYIGLFTGFWAVSTLMSRWRLCPESARIWYGFFPLPLALCLAALAHYGAVEWLHSSGEWDDEATNRWLMGNGVLYFIIALLSADSRRSYVRFWGALFMLMVPVHLLTPAQLMYDKGHALMTIGNAPFTTYELAAVLIALLLTVIGTRLRSLALALPAAAGVAAVVFRGAYRHFHDNEYFALILLLLGGLLMTLARRLLTLRMAEEHPANG